MKCELCCEKLHTEPWRVTNGTLYYCDNYKCPESPKFRKYLLGEWSPVEANFVFGPSSGYCRGTKAYHWEKYPDGMFRDMNNDPGNSHFKRLAGIMQGNDPGTLI